MFGHTWKKPRSGRLNKENQPAESSEKSVSEPISPRLEKNLEALRIRLNSSSDIVISRFDFGSQKKNKGALVYVDGMVDKDLLQKNILQPLMLDSIGSSTKDQAGLEDIDGLERNLISIGARLKICLMSELLDRLLNGETILLVEGSGAALAIDEKKWESRGVDDPQTENIVRGSREGFTENLKVNTVLLRRRIKDPDLCFETIQVGARTKTDVCIAYLKNKAEQKLTDDIRKRLKSIHTDAILESGYIEQLIEDSPYSVFSTVANNEKPDKVAAKILEGRVAILTDGSPFVLTVPMLFIESFQAAEDYYSRTLYSSFNRAIRFASYIISILAPAIYVALTVFHQELIPTQLLISVAAGREPVPFPAVLEAALMLLTFDILREAGVRLPKPVGSAVSIVGALVLGQSAVSAGLISPLMIIVVAATAISSFVVPSQIDSSKLLRYIFLAIAGLAGGFGIIMGLLVCLVYLASLRSFGTPYLFPIAPFSFKDLRDTFIRAPLKNMVSGKKTNYRYNVTRQSGDRVLPQENDNDGGAAKSE